MSSALADVTVEERYGLSKPINHIIIDSSILKTYFVLVLDWFNKLSVTDFYFKRNETSVRAD